MPIEIDNIGKDFRQHTLRRAGTPAVSRAISKKRCANYHHINSKPDIFELVMSTRTGVCGSKLTSAMFQLHRIASASI